MTVWIVLSAMTALSTPRQREVAAGERVPARRMLAAQALGPRGRNDHDDRGCARHTHSSSPHLEQGRPA
jgi:hypothetical protein